jgi:hypothetical protein
MSSNLMLGISAFGCTNGRIGEGRMQGRRRFHCIGYIVWVHRVNTPHCGRIVGGAEEALNARMLGGLGGKQVLGNNIWWIYPLIQQPSSHWTK